MGIQLSGDHSSNMKAFLSLFLLSAASAQILHGGLAPTVGQPTPPHPITNGIHGGVGVGVVGHGVGIGHGVAVGHGVGVVGHGVVGHGVVGHGVVGHGGAPGTGLNIYPDEISPYTYQYNVADDYSGSNFQAQESDDGTAARQGSYSVALPDGRIQHVNYHANDAEGYVAEVVYDGTAAYPEVAVGHGVVGHGVVGHGVAHVAPVVAHVAPVVATVAHPVAVSTAHPVVGHGVGHAVVG